MQASSHAAHDRLLAFLPAFWQAGTPPYFDPGAHSWQVFSHADVVQVLAGASLFSQPSGDPDVHPTWAGMWVADEPRHRDLKALAAGPFRARVMPGLGQVIRSIADELIDAIIRAGTGRFELMTALARPLSARVICRIMGVDVSDEIPIRRWVEDVYSRPTGTAMPAQPDMVAHFTRLLEDRRARPGCGLVDELLAAQRGGCLVAGEPLGDRDLLGNLWGLLAAGFDTAATGMANLLLFLSAYDSDCGCLKTLYGDRDLVPGAVEETLRWYPPFPAHTVIARTALTVGTRRVEADDLVTGWITSANRDPRHFPSPNLFDIRRTPNPHLSFGRGIRFCLGAPLVRLELCTVLNAVLDRLPRLRWDYGAPFRWAAGPINRVQEAHMAFG